MKTARSREGQRVTKKQVKLWFALPKGRWDDIQVFAGNPRLKKDTGVFADPGDKILTDQKTPNGNNGRIVELCEEAVKTYLGLKLKKGETIPVTFTFGRVRKIAKG